MVMAQLPNTQYIAHEFVRQYYTVLHKDPSQLHRFYTRDSRLTHGVSPYAKSEDAVCGQEAINEKISQLHFRNCHARIRSVDSHPTIGGGVVIQVTGELSNAGMAMRKFMQTFVLAQREPKKYHVFNDIFRYQDETFEDTENDETVNETGESENGFCNQDSPPVMNQPIASEIHAVLSADFKDTGHFVNGEGKLHGNVDKGEDGSNYEEELQAEHESTSLSNQESINIEDADEDEDEEEEDCEEEEEEEEQFLTPTVQTPATETAHQITETKLVDDGTEFNDFDVKEDAPLTDEETKTEPEAVGSSKPVTWAALAKKNTPIPTVPQPLSSALTTKPLQSQQQPQQVQKKNENRSSKKLDEQSQPFARKEQNEEPRRRTNPDSHQIFIGNLPNTISEKDVREAFKEFGNIVEVRLNAKNFGFVAFDGPDPPSTILQKKQTITINGHTINTEVKRSVSGPGRGAGGGGGSSGFRRTDRDSNRNRGDTGKNTGRNGSAQNRSGKNTQYPGKQGRNSDENKSDKTKDSKTPREQRQTRR